MKRSAGDPAFPSNRRLGHAAVSFGSRPDVEFFQHGYDMLFVALRANTVTKIAVGMASDVVLDTVPIIFVVTNAFTVGADRKQIIELLNLSEGGREFTVGLGEFGGTLAHAAL